MQGEVLESELAVAGEKEGEESKQAEQEDDHRAGIFSGSAPPDQSLGAGQSFGEGQALRTAMQHATAWGATGVLRAIQVPASRRGTFIDLPSITVEVEPWCSGTQILKLLLLVAFGLALVLRCGLPWKLALVGVAAVVALEANILRVAASALSFELLGRSAWGLKEWYAGGATILGVVQVVGLGWLAARRRSETAPA